MDTFLEVTYRRVEGYEQCVGSGLDEDDRKCKAMAIGYAVFVRHKWSLKAQSYEPIGSGRVLELVVDRILRASTKEQVSDMFQLLFSDDDTVIDLDYLDSLVSIDSSVEEYYRGFFHELRKDYFSQQERPDVVTESSKKELAKKLDDGYVVPSYPKAIGWIPGVEIKEQSEDD